LEVISVDANQFDAFSRSLASGVSRRTALLRVGASGLLAGLLGTFDRRDTGAAPASHQAGTTCILNLVANIRVGPHARALFSGVTPGELRGELRVALGPDGAIDAGQLRLAGGSELGVVGQAVGRALYVRIRAGAGQTLVLVGAGNEPIDRCNGRIDGLVTGPEGSDLGVWSATAAALNEPATPSATPALAATPDAVDTVTVEAVGVGNALLRSSCVCLGGPTNCGNVCTDLLSDPFNCGACGIVCAGDQFCANGSCSAPVIPCEAPLEDCGGFCVNTATDPSNCGGCGNACGFGTLCFNGECIVERIPPCPFGQVLCGDGTCAVSPELCCESTPEGCA
jgi:hypothetical protein